MARILIAGGSLGGLLHAVLLRRAGHSVEVYEKVPEELAGRGGGIATQAPLWEILERAGLTASDEPLAGVRLRERVVLRHDGSIAARTDADQLVSSWDAIYKLLRSRVPDEIYHRGWAVERVEEAAHAVAFHFSNGEREQGDLAIAADGAGSRARSQLMPGHEPEYAGYVAWRGLVSESALDPETLAALGDRMTFYTPDGQESGGEENGPEKARPSRQEAFQATDNSQLQANEQILIYPIPGPNGETESGQRQLNLVWYRPADGSALEQLLTGEDGTRYDHSIPPPAIGRRTIDDMRAAADKLLPPPMRAMVLAIEKPFFQPVYDLRAPHFVAGRTVLVGDAAVLPRPHPGAGTTKAFEDASALSEALGMADGLAWKSGAALSEALARYEQARLGPNHELWQHSRSLGPPFRRFGKRPGAGRGPARADAAGANGARHALADACCTLR